MQVVDVQTRAYPAKATHWDGSKVQADEIIEWIRALGESKAEFIEMVEDGVPSYILIASRTGNRSKAYPNYWIVQDADGWHEPLTPEQYGELYEASLPSVEELAARLDTGDGTVKGVVDLHLGDAKDLAGAIRLAVGAASMSWPTVGGVFNDAYALDIACQLEHDVIRRLKPVKPADGVVDGVRPHLPRTPEQDKRDRAAGEALLAQGVTDPEFQAPTGQGPTASHCAGGC